jgi:hypothetical protein
MMTRSYHFTERGWLERLLKCLDEAPTITPYAQARRAAEETITPEDTLREAGFRDERQAKYQRRMSSLLAGRPE